MAGNSKFGKIYVSVILFIQKVKYPKKPRARRKFLYPNKKVKKDYDNTLPERNLSSIVSDSALKIDFSKFLKNQQFYQF